MSTTAQLQIDEAQQALGSALKMLGTLINKQLSPEDVPKLLDCAGQATQAAQQLNQSIGMLLATPEHK